MWIIASIPLWICGLFFLVLAVAGTGAFFTSASDGKETQFVLGAFAYFVMAAVFLSLAAKVAS